MIKENAQPFAQHLAIPITKPSTKNDMNITATVRTFSPKIFVETEWVLSESQSKMFRVAPEELRVQNL